MAVALDSDAVIGFLDVGDALHSAADAAIRRFGREGPLVVSAVTYAEVLTGVRRGHHRDDTAADFFAQVVSDVLPVDRQVADSAASLRAQHRSLKMPDALILASASIDPDVETLVSGDAKFASVTGVACCVEFLR